MVDAGFLMPDTPMPTDMIVEHMALFYDTVRERGPRTMTGEYASAVTRRFFDFRSPLAAYAAIPRSYVILQRINLGLFALLAELSATADWRCIAEEIWPFVQAPPCTPMGAAEAEWRSRRAVGTHSGPLGKNRRAQLRRCHNDGHQTTWRSQRRGWRRRRGGVCEACGACGACGAHGI
jgi:hypothetical protein